MALIDWTPEMRQKYGDFLRRGVAVSKVTIHDTLRGQGLRVKAALKERHADGAGSYATVSTGISNDPIASDLARQLCERINVVLTERFAWHDDAGGVERSAREDDGDSH